MNKSTIASSAKLLPLSEFIDKRFIKKALRDPVLSRNAARLQHAIDAELESERPAWKKDITVGEFLESPRAMELTKICGFGPGVLRTMTALLNRFELELPKPPKPEFDHEGLSRPAWALLQMLK